MLPVIESSGRSVRWIRLSAPSRCAKQRLEEGGVLLVGVGVGNLAGTGGAGTCIVAAHLWGLRPFLRVLHNRGRGWWPPRGSPWRRPASSTPFKPFHPSHPRRGLSRLCSGDWNHSKTISTQNKEETSSITEGNPQQPP